MIQNFFFFFFGGGGGAGEEGGSLSPPRLNIFTVGNMGVMIYIGQGGLRSLSDSSYCIKRSQTHIMVLDEINITV